MKQVLRMSGLAIVFGYLGSSLFRYSTVKYQLSKTVKLLGGKKVKEPYILLITNLWSFKGIFSATIKSIGLKCSEVIENFVISMFRDFISLASSDNDEHILYVNEAKNVNKDLPVVKVDASQSNSSS